jgi:hypothetical protein
MEDSKIEAGKIEDDKTEDREVKEIGFFSKSFDYFLANLDIKNASLAKKMNVVDSLISKIRTDSCPIHRENVVKIIKHVNAEALNSPLILSNVRKKYIYQFADYITEFSQDIQDEMSSTQDITMFIEMALWNSFWYDKYHASKKPQKDCDDKENDNFRDKEKEISKEANAQSAVGQYYSFNSVQGDVVFGDKHVTNNGNINIYRGKNSD